MYEAYRLFIQIKQHYRGLKPMEMIKLYQGLKLFYYLAITYSWLQVGKSKYYEWIKPDHGCNVRCGTWLYLNLLLVQTFYEINYICLNGVNQFEFKREKVFYFQK